MSNLAIAKPSKSSERIIGALEGAADGPTVILMAGMHGNESAGVQAVSKVLDMLTGTQSHFRGTVIGLRANINALEQNVRYVDEDMNRIWFPAILDQIRNTPGHKLDSSERFEIKQLLKILDGLKQPDDYPTILADVHTFSAEGWMFSITSSKPRQRELLSKLHVPMVFGIEETLRGTALGYYQKQGFVSFGLEGGQHDNKLTLYNTTASLLLLLQASGCIDKEDVSEIEEFRGHLKSHTQNLPVETKLVYQHIIQPNDDFEMRPGFKNFQPVKKGEWLASDRAGKIVARCDGYILMPLYQSQGNDGFFIIKEHD
ncbi:MAG: succinylglutamate desuccinylase/aspartoacylase family protein [Balneolaceae bacterium]